MSSSGSSRRSFCQWSMQTEGTAGRNRPAHVCGSESGAGNILLDRLRLEMARLLQHSSRAGPLATPCRGGLGSWHGRQLQSTAVRVWIVTAHLSAHVDNPGAKLLCWCAVLRGLRETKEKCPYPLTNSEAMGM